MSIYYLDGCFFDRKTENFDEELLNSKSIFHFFIAIVIRFFYNGKENVHPSK